MGKIEAHFEVDDDIDPAITDPMELIDNFDHYSEEVIELISAEWVE